MGLGSLFVSDPFHLPSLYLNTPFRLWLDDPRGKVRKEEGEEVRAALSSGEWLGSRNRGQVHLTSLIHHSEFTHTNVCRHPHKK